jgi:hypothetical protein
MSDLECVIEISNALSLACAFNLRRVTALSHAQKFEIAYDDGVGAYHRTGAGLPVCQLEGIIKTPYMEPTGMFSQGFRPIP